MRTAQHYDIIIIGAGLIGTSMVVALQNQGLKIAIIETHLPDVTTEDTRPLTLSYGSMIILESLRLWSAIRESACAIHTVHVSNQGALGAIHFQAQEHHVPALGYVVSLWELQRALYHRAIAQDGVDMIPIHQLCQMTCDAKESTVVVNTAQGELELRASLLIAADGTHSTARALLHIATEQQDYNDVAFIAEMQWTHPHHGIAYERFTREGTLAILPLFNRCHGRLVWTMDKKISDQVQQWSDEALRHHVQNCFLHRLPTIAMMQRGACFPLKIITATEQIRPGLVLLGNAAHTIYPIAAQGFNLGLRDVAVLAEVIVAAKKAGKALGDFALLQEYYHWRQADQNRVGRFTANITNVFELQLPLLSSMRGLGLLSIDLLLPIKKRIAKQMMGLSGRLPRLARGVEL